MRAAQEYYDDFLKHREGNNGGIQRHKDSIIKAIRQAIIDTTSELLKPTVVKVVEAEDIMKYCPWCTDHDCRGNCIEDNCSLST